MAKHQSRLIRNISVTLGLCVGILRLLSKLIDVQSRINCTNCPLVGLPRMWDVGCMAATALRRSGRIRRRHSAVALQVTNTCSDVSAGAEQSFQAGLRWGWSRASL